MKLQYAGDTGWEMPAALPDVDDAFEPPPSKELPSGEELPQGSWAWPEVAKYQILTYRFAASEPKHCADLTDYRGGTYTGIRTRWTVSTRSWRSTATHLDPTLQVAVPVGQNMYCRQSSSI